ncbi:MAG: hypothetical protein WAL38_26630 [Solirubrobacteraceae bacterium]
MAFQAGPWDLGDGLRSLSGKPVLRARQAAAPGADADTHLDAATDVDYDLDSYSYSYADPEPNSDTQADSEDLLHFDSASSSHRERVSVHGYGQRELGPAGNADA